MRPLEVREVVGLSWGLYKSRFGALMSVSLVLVAIPSLLQWLPGIGALMTVALLFTELLATGAFVLIAASQCVELGPTAAEAVRAAWGRYWRLLGMLVLSGLAVAAVAMVMIAIGTVILSIVASGMLEELNLYADNPLAAPPRVLLPFLVWTFVMLLPAIALAIAWLVAPMAVMVEGAGAVASLRRSWQLVVPNIWRATRVLLLSVAVIVPPIMVLSWLFPYYLTVLASVWFVPFATVIGTVLYLDLRTRSENLTPEALAMELSEPS